MDHLFLFPRIDALEQQAQTLLRHRANRGAQAIGTHQQSARRGGV